MKQALFFLLVAMAPIKLFAFGTTLIDNDSSFHVTYVRLELTVRPDTEYIAGNVMLRCVARSILPDNVIQLSLKDSQSVDTVWNDGVSTSFQHEGDSLFITLGRHYAPGDVFDVTVFYHGSSRTGDPVHTTQIWDTVTKPNYPISWSVSEPFIAKRWWPCKDNPADKIDSADLIFTCSKPYSVCSNGLLTHVDDHDTSQTFYWHESYPIAHYLVAFICTYFDTLTHWHHFADGDSMKIMNYVYPGAADTMGSSLIVIDTILNVYERWFGPYPFRKEKYGMAMWRGGGMENETLSFCNNADSGILAHETSHQWFGDAITCKTWNNTWINEGFATYTADLFNGRYSAIVPFDTIMKSHEKNITSIPGGTVYTQDSDLLDHSFDNRLVYNKGAMLLHMLNFVLGSDSAYFYALRAYVTGPLRYGVASAEDFRDAVEQASGRDLTWFFNEWVYGDGYPIYSVSWDALDGLHPAVAISETGSTPESPFFTMPIELEFIGDGIDTFAQVFDDEQLQAFQFTFSRPVAKMIFDPHNWLLDGELPRTLSVEPTLSNVSGALQVIKNLNSFDINFTTDKAGAARIQIYDLLGRIAASIDCGVEAAGQHSISWRPNGLCDGVYYCRQLSDGSPDAFAHFVLDDGE